MAFDQERAMRQRSELADCEKRLGRLENNLSKYRQNLNNAWSAKEITELNRTVDDLRSRSRKLRQQLDDLGQAVELAIVEILEEEAAAASAQTGEGA